jgi:membrane protease YdiL (CAAX protease family)
VPLDDGVTRASRTHPPALVKQGLFYADDHRLRAPWRIALFILVAIATYLFATLLVTPLIPPAATLDTRALLSSYLTVLSVLVAHVVALHWFEPNASWTFVGLNPAQATPRTIATGLILGVLAIGIPSLILILTHNLRVDPSPAGNWWTATSQTTLFLLPAALAEELFLRGYIFAVLRESIGWKRTLIGTSIIFGLLHLQNPSATAESTLLVIIAGFFLGAILLATNSLYAAWMAHFAWNWTMAAAFHTAVSGLGLATPNYHTTSIGPTWLTGGPWGPEGGLAAGISMFTCILFLYATSIKQKDERLVSGRKGVAEP